MRVDDIGMLVVRSRLETAGQIVVSIVVFVGLTSLIDRPGAENITLGAMWFVVSLFLAAVALTSLHETAHAVVGRLVGWNVFGVTIGRGPRIVSMNLGSVRLDLRGALVGGVTIANATGRKWRDVAMLAAGVTVEIVAIMAALFWDPDQSWAETARLAILVVAGLDIAVNLWPRALDLGSVTGLTTDGAQLLKVLTATDEWRRDIEQHRMTPGRAALVQTLHGGDLDGAIELARIEAAADPAGHQIAALLGTLLLFAGRWREAYEQLVPTADAPAADAFVANNVAWAAVMTFDPVLFPSADRYSERALAALPTEPACANTRGATLVLLGRVDEGLTLLERAASGRLSKKQKAYVMAFTALAEHRLGRHKDVKRHLAMSRRLDKNCPARPEVKQLMRVPMAPPDGAWPPPPTS